MVILLISNDIEETIQKIIEITRGLGIPRIKEKLFDLNESEKLKIISALKYSGWEQKLASKLLGISPRVLNYKIRKHNITHPSWYNNKPLEDKGNGEKTPLENHTAFSIDKSNASNLS